MYQEIATWIGLGLVNTCLMSIGFWSLYLSQTEDQLAFLPNYSIKTGLENTIGGFEIFGSEIVWV